MSSSVTTEQSDAYLRSLGESAEIVFNARQAVVDLAKSDTTETPLQDIYERLLTTRRYVDAIEHQLVLCVLARSRVDRLKILAEGEVEDAEIAGAAGVRKDFESARDRGIEINSRTMEQRRALRRAQAASDEAFSVVRAVQEMHRGADSYRRELEVRIRTVTMLSSLDH